LNGGRKSLGIIGQGEFGAYAARILKDTFEILTYSRGDRDEQLAKVTAADYVMLAVPVDAYDELLPKIKPHLGAHSVIVDVCSVKQEPLAKLGKYLPQQAVLATHPLFGPQTAPDSVSGHTILVCPQPGQADLYAPAEKLFHRLGLEVTSMSAADHDILMAELQGLTFYVAQALVRYGVSKRAITTPSYNRLLALADLERHHSPELFRTIQLGNSHTAQVRDKFRAILSDIESELTNEST
jgi:prephenate dehydrogenase